MKAADIQAIWPQWENIGLLGKGRYGSVHLCHSSLDGQDVFSAVKVVTIPPDPAAIEAAQAQGISRDMLKLYFGKFREKGDVSEFDLLRDEIAKGNLDDVSYISCEPQTHPYPFENPLGKPYIGFPEISMCGIWPWGGYGAIAVPMLMGNTPQKRHTPYKTTSTTSAYHTG